MKKVFKEVAKVFKEVVKVFKEVAKVFKEVAKVFKEVAKVFKEVVKVFKEVVKVFKEVVKVFKEVVKVFKEVAKVFKEVVKVFKDLRNLFKDFTTALKTRLCHWLYYWNWWIHRDLILNITIRIKIQFFLAVNCFKVTISRKVSFASRAGTPKYVFPPSTLLATPDLAKIVAPLPIRTFCATPT